MGRSGGIGQLFKGVIMGIVLILAIIGSMSMLNKNKDADSTATKPSVPATTPADIKAPEINIASQNPDVSPNKEKTEIEPEKESVKIEAEAQPKDAFQPVLEGERTEEEKKAEVIKYGILKISTINPENKDSLNASYVVFNSKNTKVAESNNTSSASYRLPEGNYRVVTTLVKSNDGSTRDSAPVQSTKTITITAHKLNDVIVELEPPPTIGVLQVSATNAKTHKALKANFIIQKENGETVASRQNVTNSLFKLKAGSYKVTVKSGNNSDFRTIVVEPGESTTEVFKLQEAFSQGKLFVRVIDIQSNNAVRANIEISTSNGKVIQTLKAVSQTEIALVAGNYKIKVTGQKGVSSKNISIVTGQPNNQVFRIDAPTTAKTASVHINDNVKISAVDKTKPVDETSNNADKAPDQNPQEKVEPVKSILKLFARNAVDQKPLKSNFYVQTPNGKHIARQIYADSANFNLEPGKYRLTVRSENRKIIVRNIVVSANQAITEVFSLQRNSPIPAPVVVNNQTNPTTSAESEKPKKTPSSKAIPNGFLNVAMQPARNTHFIISDRKGRKVVELTSVPSGNFKLDTGIYNVTAILNGQRRKQTIQVHQGKTTRLNFNANDFQTSKVAPQKGFLRSRIVDNAGRPLKGNLTVTNARGKIVARANNVTFGQFDLPAAPHTIAVNYQGLSGSERVNITAGKTTMQTFTISPNNTSPAQEKPTPARPPRDANDILRDKLKEELRRIF